MKQCSTCKEWKPVSEFHKRRASPDGLSYICKKCSIRASREYYRTHKKEHAAYARQYRIENADRKKQRDTAYREAHREELRAQQREYAKRNEERIKAYKSSPHALELRRARRRLVKAEAFEAYGGPVCSRCGEGRFDCLTIDHIAQDGAAHRKKGEPRGSELCARLKRQGWPADYRILCQNCQRIVYWEWRRPQLKQSDATIKARAVAIQHKIVCFEAYGGARCAECGETNLDALSLDHINNDGAEHRRQTGTVGIHMYRLLKRQGCPDPVQLSGSLPQLQRHPVSRDTATCPFRATAKRGVTNPLFRDTIR